MANKFVFSNFLFFSSFSCLGCTFYNKKTDTQRRWRKNKIKKKEEEGEKNKITKSLKTKNIEWNLHRHRNVWYFSFAPSNPVIFAPHRNHTRRTSRAYTQSHVFWVILYTVSIRSILQYFKRTESHFSVLFHFFVVDLTLKLQGGWIACITSILMGFFIYQWKNLIFFFCVIIAWVNEFA